MVFSPECPTRYCYCPSASVASWYSLKIEYQHAKCTQWHTYKLPKARAMHKTSQRRLHIIIMSHTQKCAPYSGLPHMVKHLLCSLAAALALCYCSLTMPLDCAQNFVFSDPIKVTPKKVVVVHMCQWITTCLETLVGMQCLCDMIRKP